LIFRHGSNAKERKLALTALRKINSLKSMAYIYQGMAFEKNDFLKEKCNKILSEYYSHNKDITDEDLQITLQ